MQESWMSKQAGEKKTIRHYFLESVWVALRRPAALLLPFAAVVKCQHTIMKFLEAAIIHQHHDMVVSKWLGECCPVQSLALGCSL